MSASYNPISCISESDMSDTDSVLSDILQCDGNITLDSDSINENEHCHSPAPLPIPTIISSDRPDSPSFCNRPTENPRKNLIRIKWSNKIVQASSLPIVVNLNPRSLYNKSDEFKTFIEETGASLCCVSESWDRSHVQGGKRLDDIIKIEGYRWVQNIVQRRKNGGKPALLISEKMFYVKEVCPDLITVPVGVEACWAILTPRNDFS